MASLVLDHKSTLFKLDEVQNALRSLKAGPSELQVNYLAATIAERKGQMDQAVKQYQQAAEQGCQRSIKRLLDYFAFKNDTAINALVALGVKHREPVSTVVDLVCTLAAPEKANAKSFKTAAHWRKSNLFAWFWFCRRFVLFQRLRWLCSKQ